ncbi:hypothetical protein ACTXI4_17650 [Glutamicibacter ardleyensis]|uniref:hypothetical protein n=1 Tax=Glutamicibacter ardleyensis TaxID=225894 RepID=UPI003FD4ABE9
MIPLGRSRFQYGVVLPFLAISTPISRHVVGGGLVLAARRVDAADRLELPVEVLADG